MTEERIQLLNLIGFRWDPLEQEWQDNYELLKQHVKENCDAKVPKSYPILGVWVGIQRRIYKSGKISEERIRLLDEVGFIWDASSN